MPRAKEQRNGRLEEAMTNLLQAQASLAQNLAALAQNQTALRARVAAMDNRFADMDRRFVEMERSNSERFFRIEAILIQHSQILQALPEAVREKIDFKAPEKPRSAE